MTTATAVTFLLRTTKRNPSLFRSGSAGTRRDFSLKSPGRDPLELLRQESEDRDLCDAGGFRRPGRHWSFALAAPSAGGGGGSFGEGSASEVEGAPNLRTLGFQRVSSAGADFVVRRGPHADLLARCRPVSMLYTVGKYRPGERVEQWRADGHCEKMNLGEIIDKVPHYTITEMVSSARVAKEIREREGDRGNLVSKDRMPMGNPSHFTELVQKTRIELENGDIPYEELEACLVAWRFLPDRMERMIGGPDQIMWDRWEWIRAAGGSPDRTGLWNEAQHLLPY